MKKSFVAVLILIGLLSLILIGCGNTVKNTDDKKGKEPLMTQIKNRGKIVVAVEATFAPFEFIEDGKIVGYNPDILEEISKSTGIKIEYVDLPFSGILTSLEAEKVDFIGTGFNITEERKQKVDFTMPIADATHIILKLKGNEDIKSIEDINGKIMGTNLGSGPEKTAKELDEKLKAEGKKGFEIKSYQSNPEIAMDLKNGRIDFTTMTNPMANILIKENPDTYEIVGEFTTHTYMAWGVRKENKDLLEFLNVELLKLKKSGKLAELQQKWFGTNWDLPDK